MDDFESPCEQALTDRIITRRVLAWFVDAICVAVALGVLHLFFLVLGYLTFGLGWFLAGGLWVVPIGYVFGFVAIAGATPGQALLGLRVVRDADLGPPTPAQALVYAAAFALTMWAGMIWLLVAFFTRRARCLHDMAAGVAVLRADAVPGQATWTEVGGFYGR